MLQSDRGMGRDFRELEKEGRSFWNNMSLNVVFTASELESASVSS